MGVTPAGRGTPVFTLSRRFRHAWRIRTEERTIETVAVRMKRSADALALRDASGRQARPPNWSFEQLAGIAGAPPKYLRTLPAIASMRSTTVVTTTS